MQRVLVVDDDRLVADTLALIFEKNGFDTKTAYSADEALQCAREFKPHLLLCDVTMPDKDGLALSTDITREFKLPHYRADRVLFQPDERPRTGQQDVQAHGHPHQAVPACGASAPCDTCWPAPVPIRPCLTWSHASRSGAVLVVAGLIVVALGRLHVPLGRLPGDLSWHGRGWSVSFPLATSMLLSVVLSLIFWAVSRFPLACA